MRPPKPQKRAEDEKAELESKATEDRAQIEADAEKRAELIASVRSAELLPKDFDPKGKTVKEILVAAAGDEVKEAAGRSEDYLEAKVEGIIERRAAASQRWIARPPEHQYSHRRHQDRRSVGADECFDASEQADTGNRARCRQIPIREDCKVCLSKFNTI